MNLNLFDRIIYTFTQPYRVFSEFPEEIKPRDWLIPLAIVLLTSILAVWVTGSIWQRWYEEQQSELALSYPELNSEEVGEIDSTLQIFTDPQSRILWTTVAALLWFVILAGILLFMGSMLLDCEPTFLETWTIVIYAGLVYIPEYLIVTPIVLFTGQVSVETGLSLLLPDGMSDSFFYYFMRFIEPFTVWRIFLMSLGMTLFYELDFRRTMMIIYGSWLIIILCASLLFTNSGTGTF